MENAPAVNSSAGMPFLLASGESADGVDTIFFFILIVLLGSFPVPPPRPEWKRSDNEISAVQQPLSSLGWDDAEEHIQLLCSIVLRLKEIGKPQEVLPHDWNTKHIYIENNDITKSDSPNNVLIKIIL